MMKDRLVEYVVNTQGLLRLTLWVLALVSASSWAETDCSFDALIEAYQEGNKALISKCSNKAETRSKPAKKSRQSVFTPEERKLIWGSASTDDSSSGDSYSRSEKKTSSNTLAKSCEDSPRIRAAKRDVTSYRSEIADLKEDLVSQDDALARFDERTASIRKKMKSGSLMAQLGGLSSGPPGSGARAAAEYREAQEAALDKRESERQVLQDRISRNKSFLRREVRNAQRYLADAEDRIDRLRESECQ